MKFRLLTVVMMTLLFVSCSKEEVTQTEDVNLVTTAITPENGSRTPGFSSFACDPSWEAPRVSPDTSSNSCDKVLYIYYSTDPTDYGLPATATITEADINCVRQEYVTNFENLFLHTFQPTAMFEDSWVRKITRVNGKCPETKDDVETATNSDDRVCTGSNCD